MEGILAKTGNDYILYSKDNSVLGITSGTMEGRMLSLKNCEAIANGYDLDELSFDYADKIGILHTTLAYSKHFEAGFQKALEILGDKKFSEDALYDSVMLGVAFEDTGIQGINNFSELKELAVRRNIKTEWDVEIEMETCSMNPLDLDCSEIVERPKLDENGCLVLKRK